MSDVLSDEIIHLETLVSLLRRRLRILETQRVYFGKIVPASIVLEQEDTERQLAQVQADLRRLRPSPTSIQCPYLGLLTFQEADSAFFFGRDALVSILLQKVEHDTFLAVIGPSGSGKSSVVRAGLIPALKGGALPNSDKWYYLFLKPGARPLNALAASLAQVHGGILGDIKTIRDTLHHSDDALLLFADRLRAGQENSRLVLVVDQAEELWSLAPLAQEQRTAFLAKQQQPFLQCLLTAAHSSDRSVFNIFTMRADFLHRAIERSAARR